MLASTALYHMTSITLTMCTPLYSVATFAAYSYR